MIVYVENQRYTHTHTMAANEPSRCRGTQSSVWKKKKNMLIKQMSQARAWRVVNQSSSSLKLLGLLESTIAI